MLLRAKAARRGGVAQHKRKRLLDLTFQPLA